MNKQTQIETTEQTNNYIFNNYMPLFNKIARKYKKNNVMYEYNDIINECFIISRKLYDNYKDIGSNSTRFGYINKYLDIQIHNVISTKQVINIDRNKMYKNKDNKDYKQYEKVEFNEIYQKSKSCKEIEGIEYSKKELFKILYNSLQREEINKKEYDKLFDFVYNEKQKITSGIQRILLKVKPY